MSDALPQKGSNARKLIEAMPKDKGVSRSHMHRLMQSIGYGRGRENDNLKRLVTMGYIEEFGATFRHGAKVRKFYEPAPAPFVREARPFKPLSLNYISAMQRAMRFEDGRKPMSFVTMLTR